MCAVQCRQRSDHYLLTHYLWLIFLGKSAVSLLPLNGSCGPGLYPQQLWDWPNALLVKVQSGDPFNVSDPCLMEPHEVFDPVRFRFSALSTPNRRRSMQCSLTQCLLGLSLRSQITGKLLTDIHVPHRVSPPSLWHQYFHFTNTLVRDKETLKPGLSDSFSWWATSTLC